MERLLLICCFWLKEIERLGEVGRSSENRTDGEEDEAGSVRVKNLPLEEKLEIEEEMEEEQNRPEGEIDLWKLWSVGRLDLVLDHESAIAVPVERESGERRWL